MLLRLMTSFILMLGTAEIASARASAPPQDNGRFQADSGGYYSDPTSDRAWIPPGQYNCPPSMTGSRGSYYASQRLGRDMSSVASASGWGWGGSSGGGSDSQMDAAIDYMMRNRYPSAQGDCALFVRRGLAAAGIIPNVGLGHANNYVRALSRCFTNMIGRYSSPENAPVGAVLVYRGISMRGDKNARYGHVEVRTSGGYVSDYYSDSPRTGGGPVGRNRQLIGVMIRNGNCR